MECLELTKCEGSERLRRVLNRFKYLNMKSVGSYNGLRVTWNARQSSLALK